MLSATAYGGEATLDVGFSIISPAGELLAESGRVADGEGGFVASNAGRYTLVFDNSFSILNRYPMRCISSKNAASAAGYSG